jgi:hypothetical protein
MERRVQPELLDQLPVTDTRAVRARRELRRVNAWMGNAGIVAAALRRHWRGIPPRRIADLGAGDGTFLPRVLSRLGWNECETVLVDRQAVQAGITQADVFDWLEAHDSDILIANLFLHHFDSDLPRLLRLVARRCRLFVACEPERSAAALAAARLLPLIGCGRVVNQDAVISVRAGFANRDLSALWPASENWELHEQRVGLASHVFVARCA